MFLRSGIAISSAPSICSGPGISPQNRPIATAPDTERRLRCQRFGWPSQRRNGAAQRLREHRVRIGQVLAEILARHGQPGEKQARCIVDDPGSARVCGRRGRAAAAGRAAVGALGCSSCRRFSLQRPATSTSSRRARSPSGSLWAAALAHVRMADWLAPELEGRDLDVVGVVSSLPAVSERAVRFEFEVESADGERLPKKLLLAWHRSAWSEEGAALLDAVRAPGRALAVHRAAAPAARPRQSLRLRLRSMAARARHRRDRIRAPTRRAKAPRLPQRSFSTTSKRRAKRCAIAFTRTSARRPRPASSRRSPSATSARSRQRNGASSIAPASRTS